jgi:signal transduction histidine kinase/CheY-like chemotaxis protein
VKLRNQILFFLLVFGLTPLLLSVFINLPLVLDRTALFYQKAYLQNLRADFRDLDQHLASRQEMIRLLAKLPEPGLILGERGTNDQIDLARARYTGWINQILSDQRDVIQILFVGEDGRERFWLKRNRKTLQWHPSTDLPARPNEHFLQAGLGLEPGAVMVSRIRIDPVGGAEDPRQLMTMNLISKLGGATPARPMGVVVVTIDVGGLAEFYRDTLWVNHNGSYLRPGRPISDKPEAFEDFPGLKKIFAEGKLALWHGPHGEELLWVPMFLTEAGVPLWVGRPVDPSPIADFRNAVMLRVFSIILLLIFAVLIMAQRIAARAERYGQELTKGLGRVLRDGQPMRFAWHGPLEVQELGDQLTALAETHAEHLQAAREHTAELERSNRYKSEFLANVSHELRTPLNSILLLSKMLADRHSGLSVAQQRQAQVIHEAGSDLRTMIDNILDISRIEAGQVAVNLEWIELRPLVEQLLELVSPQFGEKALYLRLEADSDAPARIYSDREKVRQILKNFLSNSAKFTERGGVTIALARGEDPQCPVALSVSDTGIGIPADKQEIIFQAFQQADGSTRRRYGGTGLGLSISRELAHLLGGQIVVESSEGKGSRFTLTLPVALDPSHLDAALVVHESAHTSAPETESESKPDRTDRFPGHWVLLVERDVQSLVAETSLLESLGLRVQTAVDGDEAVETLRDDGPCSFVLVGALSDQENTCDTIRAIRSAGPSGVPPIIVLDQVAEPAREAAYQDAGADGSLTKPIDPDRLEERLINLLALPQQHRQRHTA